MAGDSLLEKLGDARRIRSYARLAVVSYVVAFVALLFMSPKMVDPSGKPLGYDFITFWSAGRLTLAGTPALAFDMNAIFDWQRIAVPASDMIFLWHYPPTFQIVAAVLAVPPYFVAYYLFAGFSVIVYVAVLRRLAPFPEMPLLILAFPAVFLCALHGQNSMISAALIAGAILMIDRRPALAGVCIGLLAFKPQLGLLFPIVLVLTGRWRVFFTAGATAGLYALVATLYLGTDLWFTFLTNTSLLREVMEDGLLPWAKMPSAFVFLRMLGVPQATAYAGQVAMALAATALTVVVWLRCGPSALAGATLVCATLLLSPYMFDYEFAILGVPIAILAADIVRRGGTASDKRMLLWLYASPPLIAATGEGLHFQGGFLFLLAALVWSASRALAEARWRQDDTFTWQPGPLFASLG